MSHNLNLKATVDATIHKSIGDEKRTITEYLLLYQTPTEVTRYILEATDPRSEYVQWLHELEPNDTVTYGAVYEEDFGNDYYAEEEYKANTDESSVPWDDLPKTEEPTFRLEHEEELREWIRDHEGWKIEWYGA